MFSFSNEKRWVRVALLVIFLATLYLNLYTVIKYGNYFLMGRMDRQDNDDVRYIRTGMVLLEKGMLVDLDETKPTVAEMPGHGLMIATAFKIFGLARGVLAFRIIQSCLQALSILLVFLISKNIFKCSKAAITASILSAFYIPDVTSSGMILMEVTYKFIFLLLILVSIYALRTGQIRYYAAGGLVWGLSCLIRPTLAAFPLVILALWIFLKYPVKEMVKLGLITVMVFVAVMSPWWVRNYLAFNTFIPFTMGGGNPFLQGTYINYDQSKDFMGYFPGKTAAETDQIEMKVGIKRLQTYFKKQPLEYIKWYTYGKVKHMWRFPYYWKRIFNIPFNLVTYFHQAILVMGFVGVVMALRSRNRIMASILGLSVIYFTVVHIPYYTFSRYAYPAMPMMIMLAAFGMVELAGRLNEKYYLPFLQTIKGSALAKGLTYLKD